MPKMNDTLVLNDKTGEFVVTANMTKVICDNEEEPENGSKVYSIFSGENVNIEYFIYSPLSPKTLYKRLYNEDK